MKYLVLTILLILPAFSQLPQPILPAEVAIVYNSSVPESQKLAEFYAVSRQIPTANLISLPTSKEATIDRDTYEKQIRQPLVKHFNQNNWWTLGTDQNNITLPTSSKIRCIVLIKGLPLRIKRAPVPAAEENLEIQLKTQNEASVDSELTLMGVSAFPLGGLLPNPYFQQDLPASQNPAPYMILVGRIDAHTFDHCHRIILDSLEAEKVGLWGRTYLDLALKGGNYAIGDEWISNIAKLSQSRDFPTIIDRQSNTFPTNYPMTEAAVYFGWYTQHRNGPFLNDNFKFQKGAIAVHLHSFSGAQLTNPAQNWSAALIDRGAAATLGNTWEPYLEGSHYLDLFYDRLLKGYSLVEAAYMSIKVLSWQSIVIGDPLYRPYLPVSLSPDDLTTHRDYKIIQLARTKWTDPQERAQEVLKAAERTKSGTIFESAGFRALENNDPDFARKAFTHAKTLFTNPADQLRQDLNLIELERRQKETAAALQILRQAKNHPPYQNLPEAKALDGLLTILDPPPPPATKKE